MVIEELNSYTSILSLPSLYESRILSILRPPLPPIPPSPPTPQTRPNLPRQLPKKPPSLPNRQYHAHNSATKHSDEADNHRCDQEHPAKDIVRVKHGQWDQEVYDKSGRRRCTRGGTRRVACLVPLVARFRRRGRSWWVVRLAVPLRRRPRLVCSTLSALFGAPHSLSVQISRLEAIAWTKN